MAEHGTSGVAGSDGVDYAKLDNAFAVGFDTSIDGGGTNRQAGRAGRHAMVAEYIRQRRALGYVEVRREDIQEVIDDIFEGHIGWAKTERLIAALAPTPEEDTHADR